jgi:hypothetical protein
VFEEDAGQLELFRGTGAVSMIEGVLGARGHEGRDGVLATLGVTGSGKVGKEKNEMRTGILITSAEPHHPRLQVTARPHTAHPRHAIPEHCALPCKP